MIDCLGGAIRKGRERDAKPKRMEFEKINNKVASYREGHSRNSSQAACESEKCHLPAGAMRRSLLSRDCAGGIPARFIENRPVVKCILNARHKLSFLRGEDVYGKKTDTEHIVFGDVFQLFFLQRAQQSSGQPPSRRRLHAGNRRREIE